MSKLVDQIMERLAAIYGAQKVGAMYGDVNSEVLANVWETKLRQYPLQSVVSSVDGLCDSGTSWPPTLTELVDMIKQESINRAMSKPLALPDDSQCVDPARARALLREAMANMRKQP